MGLERSPVKTKCGREVKPPTNILYNQVHDSKNILSSLLASFPNMIRESNSIGELKMHKLTLKSDWLTFEENVIQLTNSLTGATEELAEVRATFGEMRKQTKSVLVDLRKKLYTLGDDNFSAIEGMSIISTTASLVEALKIAEVKKNTEDKLADIDTEQKIAVIERREKLIEIEEEKEKVKFNQLRSKIKRDQVIDVLRAKVDSYSNCDPGEGSLLFTDDGFDSDARVKNWVSQASAVLVQENPTQDSKQNEMSKQATKNNYSPHEDLHYKTNNFSNHAEPASSHSKPMYRNFPTARRSPTRVSWASPLSLNPEACSYTARDSNIQTDRLDPSTRHLAIIELKRSPPRPFNGEPHLFRGWLRSLKHKMRPLNLSSMDVLDVLEAHTTGMPRELVTTFKTAYDFDIDRAVTVVLEKLELRFGGEIEIASVLRNRLLSFPSIKGAEHERHIALNLRNLSDICQMVLSHIDSVGDLKTFNQASGIEGIRDKLPRFLNSKWRDVKESYIKRCGIHPPFEEFCNFLEKNSETLCSDLPSQSKEVDDKVPYSSRKRSEEFKVMQTEAVAVDLNEKPKCVLHQTNSHTLNECFTFQKLDPKIRKLIVSSHKLCYRCMDNHAAINCTKDVKCDQCDSTNHPTILHQKNNYRRSFQQNNTSNHNTTNNQQTGNLTNNSVDNSGESETPDNNITQTLCTKICGSMKAKSCSKTVLVDVCSPSTGNKTMRVYAIVDDQSNQSFGTSHLFDALGQSSPVIDYSISTMSSNSVTKQCGRIISGLTIKGVTENKWFTLPRLFENNNIPDNKQEIATPDVVKHIPRLRQFSDKFLPLDVNSSVCLLLGRDSGNVLATEIHNSEAPFLHHTALGWALVGITCPEHNQSINEFSILKTSINHDHYKVKLSFSKSIPDIFTKYEDDDVLDLSVEDKRFLEIINNNIKVNAKGNIQMPLPFRDRNFQLPDNQQAVFRRQLNTLCKLKSNIDTFKECIEFMNKNLEAGHIEQIPRGELNSVKGKTWFIPIFSVRHPKKNKIRLVFDSAASYHGTSLNATLLRGPNQNNDLLGVLLRFRQESVAFVADIESMYHSFHVDPQQRDYLRFFWFDSNNPSMPLVQFRANVHIFGNTCSPAIAIFGMKKVAQWMTENNKSHEGSLNVNLNTIKNEIAQFICHSFYVDDALFSAKTPSHAISILKGAKEELSKYNMRLHKIISNSEEVLSKFPESERGGTKLQFELGEASLHRTLGVAWNVSTDYFVMQVDFLSRPFTRRGVLSFINSLYDPIGFVSPVILEGKLLQRKFISNQRIVKWDEPLSNTCQLLWNTWVKSINNLNKLHVQRCYTPKKFNCVERTLHVFSDASDEAIGYVIYIQSVSTENKIHVSFVCGNSKVSPKGAASIPRLELCAAVESSRAAQYIKSQLTFDIKDTYFYTDSNVVLGYINNECKQFSRYVTRRVQMIRCISERHRWYYISSLDNPADIASRPIDCIKLLNSRWFAGPRMLWETSIQKEEIGRIDEILPKQVIECTVMTTSASEASQFKNIFKATNSWKKQISMMQITINAFWKWNDVTLQGSNHHLAVRNKLCVKEYAVLVLINDSQKAYRSCIEMLSKGLDIPFRNKLSKLCPFIDENGTLRVGGRLQRSSLMFHEKHPVIISDLHPIAESIVEHYHEKSGHQGRHVTTGALADAGFYIEHGNKFIKKFLNKCVTCKKLRGRCEVQQMAQLPTDRTERLTPFTKSGCDVLGHWIVRDGYSTRKNKKESKCWALLFTCMYSRAVHIELLPGLDVSSFKNAFKRFISIRGYCHTLRSDRGTNFVGADNLNKDKDLNSIHKYLDDNDCKWIFNPPHSSHFGGVWERKIGQLRRAMDAAILQLGVKYPTRDELSTFLCEAMATVNATPLWANSSDPNDPAPISPSMLITLKRNTEQSENFTDPSYLDSYGKHRWKRVQHISEMFWNQWRKLYLQQLQARQKWTQEKTSLGIGDTVLLREKFSPRNRWPYAVVESVKFSDDKLVRSVKLKVIKRNENEIKISYLERPIHEVVALVKHSTQC